MQGRFEIDGMTLRPPRKLSRQDKPNAGAALLDYEIVQEQAAALGRLGRALECALKSLQDFDETLRPAGKAMTAADRQARAALVGDAGHALWLFIVQREACGLRDVRQVIRDYRVPAEVLGCVGAFPSRTARSRA
jgi:hypothetical protein